MTDNAQLEAPTLRSVDELQSRLREYERWFRTLDQQIHVLERERQKLSAVVNHTDAGFMVVDSEQRIVWTNRVFRERFSGAAGNVVPLGRRCHQVVCDRTDACSQCPAATLPKAGEVAHYELQLRVDAGYSHFYATAMPIVGPDGNVQQSIIMLQDISDLEVLRKSNDALRISEQRFRSIFENVAAGMVTTRIDGCFVDVNPALCRMLGYGRTTLMTKCLAEVCYPEDLRQFQQQFKHVLAGTRSDVELEMRYLRSDGTMMWGLTTAVWQFDDGGRPVYSVQLIQDIDERKRAEQALATSIREYEALVNSIEGIVWEADPVSLEFSFVSKQAEPILGYPVEQWLREPDFWRKHVHRDDLQRALEHCRRATAEKRGHELEYRMVGIDGDEIWFRDTVSVVLEANELVKLRGVMVNVTERKRAEDALRRSEEQLLQSQKMEAVGRLAGGIAHDFNNILTAIIGYSEFLLEGLDTEHPMRREAEEIRKAGRSASELTGQLLAFSRQQVLQPKLLDLDLVVKDMELMLRRVIGEHIELVTVVDEEPSAVKADPGQIQQVVLNLAVNARDAMPDGGKLTLQLANVDLDEHWADRQVDVAPGSFVLLALSDSGVGMDEATRARIFEPFFTTKGVGKGSGLGLSTVYGIVKQSGGQISVYSEPGRGTTFKIYLPRVDAETGDYRVGEADADSPGFGVETVLLVEDDESVRQLVQEILVSYGYQVIEAEDGIDALSRFADYEDAIDLIVTDVVMPKLGGRELARELISAGFDGEVLFLSGYTDSAILRQGLLEPGSHFLQKPFTPIDLARKVRQILDGSQTRRDGDVIS